MSRLRPPLFRQLDAVNYRCRVLAVLALFSFIPLRCTAAEESMDLTSIPFEELGTIEVFTASKYSQKTSEAPSSVTVITADEIERQGYRTLDEIVRNVTGFNVSYDRNYSYIGARGVGLIGDYNARFLILIDGHRLNDIVYESAGSGTDFPVDADLIDRIEIVRGPGSSLYGANAFFGVMNVITRNGEGLDGARLAFEAASRNTYRGSLSYGERFRNDLDLLVSAMYGSSKGYRSLYYPEFDDPETNDGVVQDADTDQYSAFLAKLKYKGLSTRFVFDVRDKRIPTASFDTHFGDPDTRTKDTRAFFIFQYEHGFRNKWDMMVRSSVDVYRDDGTYIYNYSEDDVPYLVSNIDITRAHWWGGEAQATRTFGRRRRLIAGFDWRYAFRADMRNYDAAPDYYSYLDVRRNPANAGVYLQGELELHSNLILNAGLRYDNYNSFGGTTNPRLALIYSPKEGTTVKFLHGYAFRAPNLYELHYNDIQSKPNPNLQPEKIRTTEVQAERYISPRLRLSGSVYFNHISQLIEWGMDPSDELRIFANSGEINSRGMELELEAKNMHGIDGRLGYALQRTVNKETSGILANSPRHIAQLVLSDPVFSERCRGGINMRYVSSRKTLGGGTAGGYFLANLTFLYKDLFPYFDLRAGLYNAFDKRYADPGGAEHRQDTLPQDGRNFRIGIVYRFAESLLGN